MFPVDYKRLDDEFQAIRAIMSAAWQRGLEDETADSAVSMEQARLVGIIMRKCCGKIAQRTYVRQKVYAMLVGSDHPISSYGMGSYAVRELIRWVYGKQPTSWTPRELPALVLQMLANSVGEQNG